MSQKMLADAWMHYQRGDLREAEIRCRQALARDDRLAAAWTLLAQLAEHANRLDDAAEHAERGVQLDVNSVQAWDVLGDVRQSRKEYRRALEAYQESLSRQPANSRALNNKAAALKALGDIPSAITAMRLALQASPCSTAIRSNLLTMLLYDHRLTGDDVVHEHRELGRWWSSIPTLQDLFDNDPRPGRKLRIGYVSPDFCLHAVMRFFEPMLREHCRDEFELFLYSECPIVDEVGRRLREHGDFWRVTWMKPAEEVARQIVKDRIDILVDLAGHTRHNRLDVFALKPAPLQATYLGYPSVTGLETIDYRLTDGILDPDSHAGIERLVRLPRGYACFQMPADLPPVSPLPAIRNGHITFGSHHPLLKLNSKVFEIWRTILAKIPSARLLLFRSDFVGDVRERLETLLAEHRLPRDRVEILATSSESREYLRVYDRVDVILDCFPFNGHTMTCEALAMGVPTLTFLGDRPAGRLSASTLRMMELPSFVAESVEGYVAKAVEVAHSVKELANLRATLRERVSRQLGIARWKGALESTYREIWNTWCQDRSSHSASRSTPLARQEEPETSPDQSVSRLLHEAAELERLGRKTESLAILQKVNEIEPWNHEHPFRLGNWFTAAGNLDEAERQFRRAVAVSPRFFAGWAMLGQTYGNQGRLGEGETAFRQALAIKPDPKAQVALATQLPQIHVSTAEILDRQRVVRASLDRLFEQGVRIDPTQGPVPNFFLLAYQGGNVRDIQRSFARLIEPPPAFRQVHKPKRSADGRIRIGFLSEYFCNHTIGTLNRGFAEHLDRRRFHLTVLSAASAQDDTSRFYEQHADRFIRLSADVGQAIRVLRELSLDVLFFADLGMSCFTLALAAMRFAPVQCVTWGHPLTTGLPTIDYFLSGSIYETPEADEHYTEKLIRLEGMQTCYPFPDVPSSVDRARFPLPADARWYGCLQTLFKFHPEFDEILAGMLRQDPGGVLVLIEGKHPRWNQMLLDRWRLSMPDVVHRIHFLRTLPRVEFLALCRMCDVLLDPIHFGGGNTTLEGLAVGTPVITWPTEFLRARLAQGMFRLAGLDELIADSASEYVNKAVRIAKEADHGQKVKREIAEKRNVLFDHTSSIRAFERFFEEVAT